MRKRNKRRAPADSVEGLCAFRRMDHSFFVHPRAARQLEGNADHLALGRVHWADPPVVRRMVQPLLRSESHCSASRDHITADAADLRHKVRCIVRPDSLNQCGRGQQPAPQRHDSRPIPICAVEDIVLRQLDPTAEIPKQLARERAQPSVGQIVDPVLPLVFGQPLQLLLLAIGQLLQIGIPDDRLGITAARVIEDKHAMERKPLPDAVLLARFVAPYQLAEQIHIT